MSLPSTILVSISLAGIALLSLVAARKGSITRTQLTCLCATLAALVILLNRVFGYPTPATEVTRGGHPNEVFVLIVLYGFMVLGMLSSAAYQRLGRPKSRRPAFEFGVFLAPILTSPIIFIPLLASIQNAEIEAIRSPSARFAMFFVAFQNGFFWKEYFDLKRAASEKH